MLPSLIIWQIQGLVKTISISSTEKHNSILAELNQVVSIHGDEAIAFIISCFLDEIDFKDQPNLQQKYTLLQEKLIQSFKFPNFVSIICKAFDSGNRQKAVQQGSKLADDYLSSIFGPMIMSASQLCCLNYALAQSNTKTFSAEALSILKLRLVDIDTLNDIPDDILSGFLNFVRMTPELNNSGISGKFFDLFKNKKINASTASGSQIASNQMMQGGGGGAQSSNNIIAQSIAAILLDFGPSCSSSVDAFQATLRDTGHSFNEKQLGEFIIAIITNSRIFPSSINSAGDSIYSLVQGNDDESKLETNWNYDVIAEVLSKECASLNWINVVRNFDQPNIVIKKDTNFQNLVKILYKISGQPLNVEGLLGNWSNKPSQLSLLNYAANSPRSVVDFSSIINPESRIEGEISAPSNLSWMCIPFYNTFMILANSGFASEVLQILTNAATMYPEYVLIGLAQVKDPASGVRADLLKKLLPYFTGIQGARPSSPLVMKKLSEVNSDLLVLLLRIAFKRSINIHDILEIDARKQSFGALGRRVEEEGTPDELLGYWCILADRSDFNLEAKLYPILERNIQFARYLATFSKNYVESIRPKNLDGSLLSIENFLVFLRLIRAAPSVVSPEEVNSLSVQANQIIVAYQQQASISGPPQNIAGQIPPRGPPPPQGTRPPIASDPNQNELSSRPTGAEAEAIEELANAYFQKIYTSDITIPDVIQMLKRFKSSTEHKEQEIFRCMIHNLFDEYRFFHKYPEKELQVTGKLFGSLIQHQLVSSITLGIALRYVLEALRKDPEQGGGSNEKMFRFGKISLEQFRLRLNEWPQYCSHLIQIPHLGRHCPDLYVEAQRAVNSPATHAPNSAPPENFNDQIPINQFNNMSMGQPISVESSLIAENISNLQVKPSTSEIMTEQNTPELSEIERMSILNPEIAIVMTPPESVRDQIHFIVNNIAKNNVEAKSVELKALLLAEHFSWFAHYLVVKRISTQLNLHSLYISVIDLLESEEMSKILLDCVFHNVTKLLQSSKITTSTSERSILRNLGTWLGQVTLARNKPLLQRRIDLKELLFWGYESGRLIAVCSFVAKIIEGCRDSKVFRPPNPWLMAILGVMRELYELEDLKMNIKFEVQVLCNNINVKMEDIPRGISLNNRILPKKDKNPDFNVKAGAPGSTSPLTSAPVTPVLPGNTILSPLPTPLASLPPTMRSYSEEIPEKQLPVASDSLSEQTVIPNLSSHVIVNPALAFFVKNPNYRRIVSLAMDRAIREMIQPVVERCSTIACVTMKQLILKDFLAEPNESHLRTAAQLMITNLAGSLALVTCKEPLRISIGNHLRSLLSQVLNDTANVEQIVQVCSNDNIDLGCKLIEKAATERAIRDAEESLAASVQSRRKYKEAGQVFVDNSIPKGVKYPRDLPDYLKPKAGGLHPVQLSVYEGFRRANMNILSAPNNASNLAVPVPGPGSVAGSSNSMSNLLQQQQQASQQPPIQGSSQNQNIPNAPNNVAPLSMSQVLETFQKYFIRIDNSILNIFQQSNGREITLSLLGNDHEVIVYIKDLILVAQKAQPAIRIEASVTFAERVFTRLVETVSATDTLRVDIFIGIIEALRDISGGSKRFAPEVFISWLNLYAVFNFSEESGRKIHRLILIALLKSKLLRPSDIDVYFATNMDSGRNMIWVEIALAFVRQCLSDSIAATYEFTDTFDTVSKMRPTNPTIRRQLQKWLTDLRSLAAAKEEQKANAAQTVTTNSSLPIAAPSGPVPPVAPPNSIAAREMSALREQVTLLLEKWLRVWQTANDQIFSQYLQVMHQYQVLKTEEAADKFFKVATELCVEACLKTSPPSDGTASVPNLTFGVIDALSKLFLLLVRLADKDAGDISVRVNLLTRILTAVARVLTDDHESKKLSSMPFDQRPYFRLLFNLSNDMGVPDMKQEPNPSLFPLLTTYSQVYMALQPSIVPGFAFSWLQLVSQKSFMPHLLLVKNQKGWALLQRLITSVLIFLQPFLKSNQLTDPVRKLYKGTLRVLLVILHDFPEFLSDYHLAFCEIIPPSCVQLRNLVLSAFPRSMRLPDPLTQNLKVGSLPEISQAPRIIPDFINNLNERGLRQRIDSYLTTRQPSDIAFQIIQQFTSGNNGNYVLPLITSVVVYIGSQASINSQQGSSPPQALDLLKQLFINSDPEGRYNILNSITNQLRYPNSHTYFFMNLILHFFSEIEDEYLLEQITRVLLERLIVHRPHPWGLLVTFIELIKNPIYGFWRHSFTRCAPEIERVLESVSRSCMASQPGNSSQTTTPSAQLPASSNEKQSANV